MRKIMMAILAFCGLTAGAQKASDLVDMGLSVMWSSVNVNADSPTDAGEYYQWGVTTVPSMYFNNWPYSRKRVADFEGTENDVATVKLGEGWSTPTVAQWQELIDNCTFETTTLDGVSGALVTSKVNGNSIFLPGVGYKAYSAVRDAGKVIYTTTHKTDSYGTSVNSFTVTDGTPAFNKNQQGDNGLPVRPVRIYMEGNSEPLMLTLTAGTGTVIAGNGTGAQLSVSHSGGEQAFSRCELTFDLPAGFAIESAAVNPTRGEGCTASVSGSTVTLSAPEGSTFAVESVDGELVAVSFSVSADAAAGTQTVSLTDARFYYDGEQYFSPADGKLPLTATFSVENPAIYAASLVDMGGSVLWSGMNIDATAAEEAGQYYMWGMTTVPEVYNATYWPHARKRVDDYEGTDNDVATVKLGEGWSTPTVAQWQELIDNCTVEETTLNGVSGALLTSKVTGNTLFLPGAGYKYLTSVRDSGKVYYMTTHKTDSYGTSVNAFTVNNGTASIIKTHEGDNGLPVRPVCVRPVPQFEPLAVTFAANGGKVVSGGEAGGLFTIGQVGDEHPFTKFVVEVNHPRFMTVANVEICAGRTDAETVIDITPNSTWTRITVYTADGSAFAVKNADGENLGDLMTLQLACAGHVAAGSYSVSLAAAKFFYDAENYMAPADKELPLTASIEVENNAEFTIETEQEVDLGLSVLWSGYYLGTETPEALGEYLQWGNVTAPEANDYHSSAYTAPVFDDWSGFPLFDAATAQWGDDWHTPTREEAQELIDNCESMPYVYNGVAGYAITSRINGKSIFMAASGTKNSIIPGIVTQTQDNGEARMMIVSNSQEYNQCYTIAAANAMDVLYIGQNSPWQGMQVRPVKNRPAEPLAVSATVSGTITANDPAGALLTLVQTGGEHSFSHFTVELTHSDLLTFAGAEIAPGRSEGEVNISVEPTADGIVIDASMTAGSDFLTKELTDLIAFRFTASRHVAAGSYPVGISSVKFFYDAENFMAPEAEEMPLELAFNVENNAEFTIETEQEVNFGLTVNWAGYLLGATAPEEQGTAMEPSATEDYAAQWGDGWHTPTHAEAEELIALCETVPYVYNGVNGFALTCYVNGKSIFLPADANGEALMMLADGEQMAVRNGYVAPVIEAAAAGASLPVRAVRSEQDGISEIEAAMPAADSVYDLQGRRVSKPSRGLYIVNGRKTVVK